MIAIHGNKRNILELMIQDSLKENISPRLSKIINTAQ
jgi:hypothetical protein